MSAEILAAIAKLPIPPTAKYVGTIMVTMRLIDSKAIAEFTDIPLRTVQRAMLQVSASGVMDATGATSGAPLTPPTPPVAPEQVSRVHACAQMESPSEIVTPEVGKIPPFAPKPDFWGRPPEGEKDAFLAGSDLILTEAERADWLPKFGDTERLDLALTQAAAFIQPNSRRPLLVQVRAQLARSAGDKIDRDQRYAKAAQAKPAPTQAARPKSWADDRNDKARAFLALLKPTEAVQ